MALIVRQSRTDGCAYLFGYSGEEQRYSTVYLFPVLGFAGFTSMSIKAKVKSLRIIVSL
jgi:hypothetical protein